MKIVEGYLTEKSWPFFADDEIAAAVKVLQSGRVNYWTGTEGKLFEKEFADYIGVKHAVALANGTLALEAALLGFGIGKGDEVIVPSRTFIATATSVVIAGAKPVYADVSLESQNITAEEINKAITSRTRAVIVVHLAGWPCEMDSISELCKKKGILLIEDCAQALGASYKGRKTGSWGDAAAFSFCQDKIITTAGEGGMFVTNHEDVWNKVWSFKDHGKNYDVISKKTHFSGYRWVHETPGSNWRISEIHSAVGRIQLKKADEWIKKRREFAARYNDLFSKSPFFRITLPDEFSYHSYYKYYVFLSAEAISKGISRDRMLENLEKNGVPAFFGSCPEIYLEKALKKTLKKGFKRLPNSTLLGETSIMLQVHPTLSFSDIEETAAKIIQSV
ncbi:MAG: DegT/DnrJ/EryC1/StrS family aminotransferase [Candidatus Riflebacteria bacterium]|nr:DegT/DnrJ/EryC1/StrS family aminotransferase [Candidatus Riflebacteria bacterium]